MDPWSVIGSGVLTGDVNFGKVVAAKKALKLLGDHSDALVKLCLACADNDSFAVKDLVGGDNSMLNKVDTQGFTPLLYAVCFDKREVVDLLLLLGADPDLPDSLVGWTPLIWATHFEYLDIVESLVSSGGDPLKKADNRSGQTAIDIVKSGTPLYEYYQSHGYMERAKTGAEADGDNADTLYKEDYVPEEGASLGIVTGGTLAADMDQLTVEDRDRHATKFVDDDEQTSFIEEVQMAWDEFDFNVVLPKQSIAFNDDNLGYVIDYTFTLQQRYPNKPIYPATIMFMCIRSAASGGGDGAADMASTVLSLYLTHVRSVTGTKSGAMIPEPPSKKSGADAPSTEKRADIVTIGYWLACLNHLYYFLSRDVTGCIRTIPGVLQELVSAFQPLVAQIAFTLDAKLDPMLEPCLLDYNSVPDLNTVFKRDWKWFKKHQEDKTTYQEIVDMLYPPSIEQQIKPSPLRIIQTLGALLYVLELFHVNDELKQQCFAEVLYWLNSSIFNRVLARRRYTSRSKALQIRLNLSYIQDWLRTNDMTPFKADDVDFNDKTYPDAMVQNSRASIKGVARFRNDPTNPEDATFFFNSLYKIGRLLSAPVTELLEWLQVMTGISDSDGFKETVANFSSLNSAQLLQTIKQYNYEVDEPKFAKPLQKWLKANPFDAKRHQNYASMSEKTFLNVGHVFPLALPGYMQLLHEYGFDLDGMNTRKVRAFQPNIPVEVQDDVDDALDREQELDVPVAVENEDDEDEDDDEIATGEKSAIENGFTGAGDSSSTKLFEDEARSSDLFKSLAPPSSAAQKTWATSAKSKPVEEQNPWA